MNLKKVFLVVSGLSTLVFIVLFLNPSVINCHINASCAGYNGDFFLRRDVFAACFITFFFFFFFSCVTYFMRKEVFKTWLILGLIYLPVSIIWSFNTASYDNAVLGNSPSLMSIFIAVPFIILSIIVITASHFYYKSKKH